MLQTPAAHDKAVLVRNSKTVWLAALALLFGLAEAACGQRTKGPTSGPAPRGSAASSAPGGVVQTLASSPAASSPGAPESPAASSTATAGAPQSGPRRSGSAYFGCGVPIPDEHLWDETSEDEVFDAISAAKACARSAGRRVLLEFVAPWCADCREMERLEREPGVAAALRERFERVRINIGKWDRHEGLRASFGVKALATYIVIDPTTSQLLAKTTLEPITRRGPELTADDWARWLSTH